VTVHGSGADAHLVGYVVGAAVTDLAGRLRLPPHLVPHRWVAMDALPVTANGKVDRAALPAPGPTATRPPATVVERLAAAVWQDVLGVDVVGAEDDFFALGGHSFAATRVVGRLREALGCTVSVRTLFDHRVLADFAVALERIAIEQISKEL